MLEPRVRVEETATGEQRGSVRFTVGLGTASKVNTEDDQASRRVVPPATLDRLFEDATQIMQNLESKVLEERFCTVQRYFCRIRNSLRCILNCVTQMDSTCCKAIALQKSITTPSEVVPLTTGRFPRATGYSFEASQELKGVWRHLAVSWRYTMRFKSNLIAGCMRQGV